MSTIVDQIKEKVDIVDVISSYLKLQKAGINYKARCPFHNEKSGSFFVSPERQIWHCFGCSAGGDVFGFVKQIEGIEFPEALKVLAARAGVELEARSPEYQQFQSSKTKLVEISELAMRFFEKQLQSPVGQKVLTYLHGRGMSDESIKNFHLGYAPDSYEALFNFLQTKYSAKDIFDAGLAIQKDRGGYYDRFRSRIMFPIQDINGQTVGFTGRIFDAPVNTEMAKYVNTPQTAVYDKSRILYGLDKAKLEVRKKNKCLVVEGNMDVIMSHQAGATNVVASSGTALTDGHLKIIKRYTDNLDLCFDSDNAGTMATERGVDLALARGFNIGIIAIDEKDLKDPADYIQKYGVKWAEYSEKSQPFMEFYFTSAKKLFDVTSALGKKLMVQKLIPFLASMVNKVEQAHWMGEIALALKTKEEILYEEMSKVTPKAIDSENEIAMKPADISNNLDMQEESLLSLIIKKPELAVEIKPESEEFLSERFKSLVGRIKKETSTEVIAELTASVGPEAAMNLEFAYLKSQELWKDFKDTELTVEFQKLLSQIQRRKVSAQLESMAYDIRSAEKAGDKTKLAELINEFSKISKKLTN
jgi:DNA primase